MPNQYYSPYPETNETGPQQKGTVAPDSTGHNSKKTQKGGWSPSSALGRSPGSGRVSTSKSPGAGSMRTSTNRSGKDGWRCSSAKGGLNY